MQGLVCRTLFFHTSIVNRKDAGLERERIVKGWCEKTVVFAHAFSKGLAKSACFSSTFA
jgi:hypothetical protein